MTSVPELGTKISGSAQDWRDGEAAMIETTCPMAIAASTVCKEILR
jgi:hypothetical protein